MGSEPEEKAGSLLERLRGEIFPMLEEAVSGSNVFFSNPHIIECWKALDCKSADCRLYGNGSGPLRCWQVADTYCNRKTRGSLAQKYNECRDCKVFKDSRPTIVEEIGEHFNNMIYLLNEQKQKNLGHKEQIENLRKELSSVLEELSSKKKEIREIMITDKLTTLFNRQHLITVLEDEIARCQRYGRPLAVMLIDIDEFKSFNDAYGHQAGDNMLSFVGSLIKENTRKFDRAFRYGGEEFVVVLPETDLTMAYIVAERIRRGFEIIPSYVIRKESVSDENISQTISIGITATFAYGTQDISIEELINQTENALHKAKDKGGNMCIRYE
ncbi:MAG TPA: GGDEF domain-containing protein [Nitrospirae bacterium]|nr:response regulator PleD [bacterium BMS3Abin06]HDH12873.1 GGDEF domain-containing protein [Nitrospirota bacterium]HDZ00481.1 GGDEF domain-containing protein [Nitrospirota bacterium]